MGTIQAVEGPSRRSVATAGRCVALALLVATALPLAALEPDRAISQYAHSSWRIEDGLPHSVVRSIAQTDDGYLWLATYEGLARFNGESFTRFNKKNLPGLERDTILAMMKSSDGSLWIGTNGAGGGRLTSGRSDAFVPLPGLPAEVLAFAEGRAGTIWIGTSTGLYAWTAGKLERVAAARALEAVSVLCVVEAPDGTVWVGTRSNGLHAIRSGAMAAAGFDGRSVHALRSDPDGTIWVGAGDGLFRIAGGTLSRVDAIPVDQVTAIHRDSDRTLWVGTYANGLWRLAADGSIDHLRTRQGLLNNSVRSLFEDAERTLWVGTNSGLESFVAGKFVTIGPVEGLSDAYTRSAFQDRAGNVWIGTGQGLNKIAATGATEIFTTADGLSSDYVFAVCEAPDGAMWIGTSRGVNRYQNGRFTAYQERDGLPSATVRAVHCERSGTVWIGTDSGALRFTGGKLERVKPGRRWDSTYVQAFAEEPGGALWLGSAGRGIARWENGTIKSWDESDGLPDGNILSLLLDRSGTLWIGTDSAGLIRMKDGRFTQYTTAAGLPSDKVLQMLEDDEGRLWAGGGQGIWFASLSDLDAFAAGKLQSVKATSFGTGDGIRSVQCNGSVSPGALRSRDGRLWFPTVDGVATILPRRDFPTNRRKPPVKIEQLVVDGKPANDISAISLAPGWRQLEVHYSALTYVSPHSTAFRYRLEGFDEQWVEAGTRRTAYYTGVPPGRYRFRVIAANADGVWNMEGAGLDVEVVPRFVETPWFPLLVVAGVVLLVLLYHLRRVHTLHVRETELVALVEQRTRDIRLALDEAHAAREEAERQRHLVAEALVEAEAASRAKSSFLANVSHELRTPLNAIIGFAHVLQTSAATKLDARQLKFMDNIATSGEHLLRLINEILDIAKIEAGKITLDLEEVELGPLIESVAHTARGLTVVRGAEIDVRMGPGVSTIVADPTKLKQIVFNLVSNAAKFSPSQSPVTIETSALPAGASPLGCDSVAIAVSDEGVGIETEHHDVIFEEFHQLDNGTEKPSGTGLGLALVRRFVELHGGTILLESAPGEGSRFTVVLPRNATPAA